MTDTDATGHPHHRPQSIRDVVDARAETTTEHMVEPRNPEPPTEQMDE